MVLRFDEAAVDLGSLVGNALAPLRSVADDALRDAWITVKARLAVMAVALDVRVTSAAAAQPAARHSDAEIERAVETRLRSNRMLCRSHIRVQDVYDGVVRLAGTARSKEEDMAAFEEAMEVPGVRRVTSEVVINPSVPSMAVGNLAGVLVRRGDARDAAAA